MSDKVVTEKNIELEEQTILKNDELQERELMDISSDERYIELEIEKELVRMDKEIELDISKVVKNTEFARGVKEGMLLAGFYNSLVSCGISNKMAEDMTINAQTCNHNRQLQEIISNNALEIVKAQQNIIQNQTL